MEGRAWRATRLSTALNGHAGYRLIATPVLAGALVEDVEDGPRRDARDLHVNRRNHLAAFAHPESLRRLKTESRLVRLPGIRDREAGLR